MAYNFKLLQQKTVVIALLTHALTYIFLAR